MLKRKFLSVSLIFCMLTALVGCSNSGNTQEKRTDWARYTAQHGMMMVTDEAYLFYNPEWQCIQATDLQCSAPAIPICTKAQCTHSDSSCSAYVDVPTYFYSWGNRVYYITLSDDGSELYSMNITGEDRKLETTLPQLDVQDGSLSYNFCIGDDYLLLYALTTDIATNAQNCQLFLFDMNDLKAEPVTIFSTDESDCMIDHYMYVMDGWAFYGLYSSGKEGSLYGYEIATGETKELVQNWSNRNSLVVKDGMLYWCAVNKGIYSVELATGKSTEYQHFDTGDISGTQGYDDQYIYLSYLTDDPKVVIYDYEGNQIAETKFDSPDDLPIYFFCSADKAYFSYTGLQGADLYSLPVCYLEKSAIAQGTAEFTSLSYSK